MIDHVKKTLPVPEKPTSYNYDTNYTRVYATEYYDIPG